MIHIPILRAGRSYRSLNTVPVPHVKTGEPVARVSQANQGLIAKDLHEVDESRRALEAFSVSELLAICKEAAQLFAESELPVDGTPQSPDRIYSVAYLQPQECQNRFAGKTWQRFG